MFAAYALPRSGVTTPSRRPSALIEPLRAEAAQTDREGAHETLAQAGRGRRVVGRLYKGHVNALLPIERHDGDAQRARGFADAVSGCLFGVWITQAEGGAAMAAAGHGWRLTGAKTFASGRGHVERALATAARQDGGGQLTIVDTARRPPRGDRSFWQPLGRRASTSLGADFAGTRLETADLLGEPGDICAEPMFSGGAVRFAAVQQGGIETVFDEANALQVLQLAERFVGARGLLRPEIFERLHRDLTHHHRQPAPDAVLANAGGHVLDAARDPAARLWH